MKRFNKLFTSLMIIIAASAAYGQSTTQGGVRIDGAHTAGNMVVFGDGGRSLVDVGFGFTEVTNAVNLAASAVQPYTDGDLELTASSNITLLGQGEMILVPVDGLSVYAGAGDDPTVTIDPDGVVIGPPLITGQIESPSTLTISAEDRLSIDSDGFDATVWGDAVINSQDLSGPRSTLGLLRDHFLLESLGGYKEARIIATNGTLVLEWKGGVADSLHRHEFGAVTNYFSTPVTVGNATNSVQALNQTVADGLYVQPEDLSTMAYAETNDFVALEGSGAGETFYADGSGGGTWAAAATPSNGITQAAADLRYASISDGDPLYDTVVVVLGDSTSAYGSVPFWPIMVATNHPGVALYNCSYGGWETGDHITNLVAELDLNYDSNKINRVFLMLGFSNYFGGDTASQAWGKSGGYLDLVTNIIQRAGTDDNPWRLMCIPQYAWPGAAGEWTADLNVYIRENAGRYGYDTVEIWNGLLNYDTGELAAIYNVGDGHINTNGHAVVAGIVEKYINGGFQSYSTPGFIDVGGVSTSRNPLNLMGTEITTNSTGISVSGKDVLTEDDVLSLDYFRQAYNYEQDLRGRYPDGREIQIPSIIDGELKLWMSQQRNTIGGYTNSADYLVFDWANSGSYGVQTNPTLQPIWGKTQNGLFESGYLQNTNSSAVKFDSMSAETNVYLSYYIITDVAAVDHGTNKPIISQFGVPGGKMSGFVLRVNSSKYYYMSYFENNIFTVQTTVEDTTRGIKFIGGSLNPNGTDSYINVDGVVGHDTDADLSIMSLPDTGVELFTNTILGGYTTGCVYEVVFWEGKTTTSEMESIRAYVMQRYE